MSNAFFIADDSPGKIELLRRMLEHAGWDGPLLIAQTTDQAKEIIRAQAISFAFIDYYIPTDNGPAVIAYLRAAHPSARIALVSSSDKQSNFDEARTAGAEACICTTYAAADVEYTFAQLLSDWLNGEKE